MNSTFSTKLPLSTQETVYSSSYLCGFKTSPIYFLFQSFYRGWLYVTATRRHRDLTHISDLIVPLLFSRSFRCSLGSKPDLSLSCLSPKKSPSLTLLWQFKATHWFWSISCFMGCDANVKTVNPPLRGSISHTCRLRSALCLNFLRITSCLWKLDICEDISAGLIDGSGVLDSDLLRL